MSAPAANQHEQHEQHEQQVFQLAMYEVPDTAVGEDDAWLYFQALCSLRTFLQQDTVDITQTRNLIEHNPIQNAHDNVSHNSIRQPYTKFQHSKLAASAILVYPERDLLWLSRDVDDDEYLTDISKYYGSQLSAIQNVIFEECDWRDVKECFSKMRQFTGIRTIYVWLESYLNTFGETPSNEKEYSNRARKFRHRDLKVLAGRNVTVQYIDHEGIIHGGFLA